MQLTPFGLILIGSGTAVSQGRCSDHFRTGRARPEGEMRLPTVQMHDAETFEFRQGRRASTDVLQAAAQFAPAQSRDVGAQAEYEISQIDIAFASGTLIGQGRVILPRADAAPANRETLAAGMTEFTGKNLEKSLLLAP